MLTEEQIIQHANLLLDKRTLTPAEYHGWISGATWANGENKEEIQDLQDKVFNLKIKAGNLGEQIAELVAALKHLNGVCRANFGIGDPQVSELLKKYDP